MKMFKITFFIVVLFSCGAIGYSEPLFWSANTFKGDTFLIKSAVFSPGGTMVLTCEPRDETVKLWNAETGAKLRTFSVQTRLMTSVAFSPDGTKVLTGSEFSGAKLWDAETGIELHTLVGDRDSGNYVTFSPDGTKVLSLSKNGTIKLWSAETGTEVRSFLHHIGSGSVTSTSFTSDGIKVLTLSGDTAKLWDTETGKELRTFSGHTSFVTSVAFSPDGTKVLTGSTDNRAKLWDAETGIELATFLGHKKAVNYVTFSTDRAKVLTASNDGTAKLWNIKIGSTEPRGTGEGVLDNYLAAIEMWLDEAGQSGLTGIVAPVLLMLMGIFLIWAGNRETNEGYKRLPSEPHLSDILNIGGSGKFIGGVLIIILSIFLLIHGMSYLEK